MVRWCKGSTDLSLKIYRGLLEINRQTLVGRWNRMMMKDRKRANINNEGPCAQWRKTSSIDKDHEEKTQKFKSRLKPVVYGYVPVECYNECRLQSNKWMVTGLRGNFSIIFCNPTSSFVAYCLSFSSLVYIHLPWVVRNKWKSLKRWN